MQVTPDVLALRCHLPVQCESLSIRFDRRRVVAPEPVSDSDELDRRTLFNLTRMSLSPVGPGTIRTLENVICPL